MPLSPCPNGIAGGQLLGPPAGRDHATRKEQTSSSGRDRRYRRSHYTRGSACEHPNYACSQPFSPGFRRRTRRPTLPQADRRNDRSARFVQIATRSGCAEFVSARQCWPSTCCDTLMIRLLGSTRNGAIMGFITPDLPDVDHDTWPTLPRSTRMQVVTRHWVEHGFGTPSAIYLLYVLKMAAYAGGAAAVISLTPGLGGLDRIETWWTQPIVYQKVVVFTLLFEVLGLGCGSGPLTARFWPPIGGLLFWLRPNTIRLPPWPRVVPFTRGDTRTIVDVALYAIVLASGIRALLSAGRGGPVTPAGDVGLLDPVLLVPAIIALALLGLRDKTVFLAARGEHYWLTLFVFFFGFTDQIAGYKIIMLALWWGAATSKLNHHFPYVVAVMTSNHPLLRSTLFNWVKHRLYRDPV